MTLSEDQLAEWEEEATGLAIELLTERELRQLAYDDGDRIDKLITALRESRKKVQKAEDDIHTLHSSFNKKCASLDLIKEKAEKLVEVLKKLSGPNVASLQVAYRYDTPEREEHGSIGLDGFRAIKEVLSEWEGQREAKE